MASLEDLKVNVAHIPAFSHGIEFLYPRTEDGPSLYALLEASWTVMALIQGIRTKVWEADMSVPNPVGAAWAKAGLIEVREQLATPDTDYAQYAVLTPAGRRVIDCGGLLEYEFSMMQQQLDGNLKTSPAKYEKLRQGLDNYAVAFLPDMRRWVTQQIGLDGGKMFDFCGGTGGYLHEFLRTWPQANGMLFDRMPGVLQPADVVLQMGVKQGDAMADDRFFKEQAGAYDIVLMSEILHCKGPVERHFLLRRAKSLLKPTGVLLVIEQYPNLRLEWRMTDMTDGGQCLTEQDVSNEAWEAGFQPHSGIHSLSHYGIRFDQRGEA
jgi:O-methyltransferase.